MAKIDFLFIGILATYVDFSECNGLQPSRKLGNTWWGPGEAQFVKPTVRPFRISVSNEELQDLYWRLQNHRPFTPPLEGIAQQYGMNTDLLNEIVEYWKTKYNWRAREQYLNRFPQFKINIQGLDIHFLHVKPMATNGLKVLPLLLVHGWPGSVREFYEIIPLLTCAQRGRNFVFEVIVPHIPGYGFSQAAAKPGLGSAEIAVLFKNMMNALGFNQFYVQGGDIGAIILINQAKLFPETVLGLHSNMCIATSIRSYLKLILSAIIPNLPVGYVRPDHYDRVFPITEKLITRIIESGHIHIQATKPDTIGVAMNDSPAGLAAYILEKFVTGTNPDCQAQTDGCLKNYFSYDDLLDNIMFHWLTRSATTSYRFYYETFNPSRANLSLSEQQVTVPTACARFSKDIYTRDGLLRDAFPNLVQLSDYEGGHFAAFELPQVLAKDVFEAVDKFRRIRN